MQPRNSFSQQKADERCRRHPTEKRLGGGMTISFADPPPSPQLLYRQSSRNPAALPRGVTSPRGAPPSRGAPRPLMPPEKGPAGARRTPHAVARRTACAEAPGVAGVSAPTSWRPVSRRRRKSIAGPTACRDTGRTRRTPRWSPQSTGTKSASNGTWVCHSKKSQWDLKHELDVELAWTAGNQACRRTLSLTDNSQNSRSRSGIVKFR